MIKNKICFSIMICLMIIGYMLLTLPMDGFSNSIRSMFHTYRWLDKVAHFTLFASLTLFVQLSFNIRRRILLCLVCFAAGGAELMQMFSLRTVSLFDFVANISGVFVVFFIINKYPNAFNFLQSKSTRVK